MIIKEYTPAFAAEVAEIYNHHVRHTTVSFETEDVTAGDMHARLSAIASEYPCIMCVDEKTGKLAGYAYAHRWKEKAAYNTTAETTVYVAQDYLHEGIGRMLMERLIADCRKAGLHALIACITADNAASCLFHERLGFRKVSEFIQVGRKFDRWLDVADYELIL